MIGNVHCVVLDCPDVMRLAAFYHALLGGRVNQPDRRWRLDEDWATLHTASGLVLAFQRAPDHRPPQWPDPAYPQQFHLDIGVEDLERAHRTVVALGASLLDTDVGWRVYTDLAGHPFCLLQESQPER